MVRVKVCGLMTERDVISCAEAGIHTLGFVADYPEPVPWNLTRDEARRSLQVPPYMHMCGTGGTPDDVIKTALSVRPSVVQLHQETSMTYPAS